MIWKVGGAVLMIVLILSCTHEAGMDTKTKVEVEADTVVFAVIGDYGYAG